VKTARNPFIGKWLGMLAGVFDQQLGAGPARALLAGERVHAVATSRNGGRSRSTGIAAAKRAALKARNVKRNRRAHRGRS
jgi:hypothetical protein